ncbi:MAG: hypothetical protein NTZ65_02635 [Candidatus Berkelbacteria bacterium]|nr:hypothetical protein [Candidatus Berkelbacteria bacterium]
MKNYSDKFWDKKKGNESVTKKSKFKKITRLILIVLASLASILFGLTVIFFVSATISGIKEAKTKCEYKNFDRDSVLQMINGLRSQSGKSSLTFNSNLNEYTESRINAVKKNDSDGDKDFYDWAKSKNDNSFNSIYSIFSYDKVNVCNARKGLVGDKQLFSSLTDSKYSQIGIATLGDSAYMTFAEIKESTNTTNPESKATADQAIANQKKNADTQYINNEIAKLEQSKSFYSNTIEQMNESLKTCPEGFYQSCYDRIKQSTDLYFEKIDGINEQIQEWKMKLIN